MNLVLALVFFLCLMFLAMIFGEKLSLFGVFDHRWLTAPLDLLASFWDMLCEGVDRMTNFVLDHFWWVTATVSGGVGIVLIALIMVSGLTEEAHAIRVADISTMQAGGVLDSVPVIDADSVIQTRVTAEDDSQLIYQYPSRNRFDIPPPPRRQPVTEYIPRPRKIEFPPLPEPREYSRGRLRITLSPFLERHGHPVRSDRVDRLIQQTVLSLRNDDWDRARPDYAIERSEFDHPAIREDDRFAEDDLYDRVRVIPGDRISSRSLRVRKEIPDQPSPGEFEIRIRITNADRTRMSGLIVREALPAAWKPVEILPRGVYRNSVVTWLVDDLIPLEERVLTLRVRSSESGRFQSHTEVSARAAVSADSTVAQPLPVADPPRAADPVRPLPPVSRRPDVRLTLEKTPETTQVGEWVDAVFRIRNVGNAPAEGVKLRVNLPLDLEHHDLADTDIDRWVDANVRRLEAGESRRMTLTVRPAAAGRHTAVAELLFMGAQLDVRDLRVTATEPATNNRRTPTPEPSFR